MEDFVNFELAKRLKEKGFSLEKTEIYGKFDSDGLFHPQLYFNYIETMDCNEIIAPTISQVLKWLREEKLILIGLSPMQEYDVEETIEWCATVYKADKQGGLSLKEELYYESYEQSALAGIEYSLDNLI